MKAVLKLVAVFASASFLSAALSACDDPEPGEQIDTPGPTRRKFGNAQLGPFMTGGKVTASELKSDLTPTGKTFTATIIDNTGRFELDPSANSMQLAEFTVEGEYFDPIEKKTSTGPLTLSAIADVSKIDSVNINVMTHLERERLKNLLSFGFPFAAAKTQASREILTIFNFAGTHSSDQLDIAERADANAKLLAISLIIQTGRSSEEVTELLSAINSDIKDDGVLDDPNVYASLRTGTLQLDLENIRQTLCSWYKGLGAPVGVPHFERYINDFNGLHPSMAVFLVNESLHSMTKIGTQWWMTSNLKTVVNPQGEELIFGNELNGVDTIPYFFTRDNNLGNPGIVADVFAQSGFFYTTAATMNGSEPSTTAPSGVQGLCPTGWHLPSLAEYDILLDHIETRGYARSLDVVNNEVGFNLNKIGWRGYDIYSWGVSGTDWALRATDGVMSNRTVLNAAVVVRCVRD